MKINQWLGYNEESSQYLLRRGELRSLVNLQPRRPGMLISRPGLVKVFGSYSEEAIRSLYRKDTPFGQPDIFLLLQQVEVERTLTEAQQLAGESPLHMVWLLSRLTMSYPREMRSILELPLTPNGLTYLQNMAIAEDRFGRVFAFFGHGAKPIMYRPASIENVAVELGLTAPIEQPLVAAKGEGYFLERVDILDGGGSYWGPPTITIEGGNPTRPAKVKAIVQAGAVTGVEILDGGSNYQSVPRMLVGTDRMGAGFRGVGVREADPGVQGFLESTNGVVTGTGHLSATDTYAAEASSAEPEILYVQSPVAAQTTCQPSGGVATTQMVLDSVANVQVGDFVTVRGAAQPSGFNNPSSLIRVVAIDPSTKTITLTRTWTPVSGATYQVLFQRNTTLAKAKATYNSATNRYAASIPLRTLTGAGKNAEATITMTPAGNGYALGPVGAFAGYTVPTGGPETPRFAYLSVGWDVYATKGPFYWNSSPQEQPGAAGATQYAGLQASGRTQALGYTGTVRGAQGYRQSVDRRADVYFPDYSSISVWLWQGARRGGGQVGNWVRRDFPVQGLGSSQPYILVTLEPAVRRVQQVVVRGGRRQTVWVSVAPPGARKPVVRVNLLNCPDEWVTNDASGHNLPTSVKQSRTNRLQWWNQSAKTARPLVDFRGAQDGVRLDWGTIEVVDEGAGWAENTEFLFRIYQANAYAQTVDYNFATTPLKRAGGHGRFAGNNRYVGFLFRATQPDAGVPFGPPARLERDQYVDLTGVNYRSGDVGCVTLGRRNQYAAEQAQVATFKGYIVTDGRANEFVFDTVNINGPYTVAGGVMTVTLADHGLTLGDRVTLTTVSGAARSGNYIVTGAPATNTFTVRHPVPASASGSVTVGINTRPKFGATIQRVSGSVITAAIQTRDTLTCSTPNTLFEFSQILQVNAAASTLALDKMCYPRAALASDEIAAVSGGNNTANSTTLLFGSPVPDYVAVGQQLIEVTGVPLLSNITPTITAVQDNEDGTRTATVSTTANGTGLVSVRPLFEFTVSTGIREAQTIRWTASSASGGDGTQQVTGIRVLSRGRNYQGSPTLYVRGGGTGYGLSARGNVENGQITTVTILDPGRNYSADPEVYTLSQPAIVSPAMRPAMRGTYRCAYRFVDRTDTVVATGTLLTIRGEEPNKVQVSVNADLLKPGMVLEGPMIPWGTRILSISKTERSLELSAPLTGRGRLAMGTQSITITAPGSGYAEDEPVTCALAAGVAGYSLNVQLRPNASGSYSVSAVQVSYTSTQEDAGLLGIGEQPITFSPPAAGGETARGFAAIRWPDAASQDVSITVRDMSRPIAYSDFSPIADVNAGPTEAREHSSEIEWIMSGVQPPQRADLVEFFRTSSDQSLVFYRLEMYGIPTTDGVQIIGRDTLTDEELFDPERPFYGAVPVVLPNGNLNAYRFGQPRTDMSVCVAFQDRLWYGVSTSGQDANTLFYSEFDEFESCPDTNELPIQNNQRSTDSLTALVPFGSILLAMQHSHTYAVQYNTDPAVDASIQMMAHRGCLTQRCWDLYDNVLYAADENGIYAMSRTGEVMPLSDAIREWFNGELLDFANRESFFLNVCNRTRTLRFFCSMASQPTPTPSMALCFHLDAKTWWIERYPNSVCSAVSGRPQSRVTNRSVYGAADGNLYEMDGHSDVAFRTLMSIAITNPGDGYKEPPTITCPQSKGVQLHGVVSEGRLVDIIIQSSGWDVWWGEKLLTEGGDELAAENGSLLDSETPSPIPFEIGPPPPGGVQATAEGIFSNTVRVVRRCSVVANTNYVTLLFAVVDFQEVPVIVNEASTPLATQRTDEEEWLRAEGTPIEPGMEVFCEALPLGCVVKSILGSQVFLELEDGSPVRALDSVADVPVSFMRRYKTHIPYQLGTGYMELINDMNVSRGGDGLISRNISLLYTPTPTDKALELIEYYNGSVYPRPNVMRRSRGGPGSFAHLFDSASTVLNLSKNASHLGASTGVARATFAAKTNTDSVGGDQHLRIDMFGRIEPANTGADLTPQQLVIHSVTIEGVVEDGE